MNREQLEARRRRYETVDADDKLDRMARDVMNGVPMAESPAVVTVEDEQMWVALMRNVASIIDQGFVVDEEAVPLAEDHWSGVQWLGQDAWRARRRRVVGG